MTRGDQAEKLTETVSEAPWRRLDPRMLVVTPAAGFVRLLPAFVIFLITGRGDGDLTRVWISLGAAGMLVLFGALRWRFTRYRITPDRVELHSGWLNRQRRSVPRDRIRTVDLTAKLEHRVFGLTVVKVGAATAPGQGDGGLALDAVSKAEADRLRRELLERPAPASSTADTQDVPDAPPGIELARLDWGWIRYAPLTFSSLAGVGVVAGAVFNLLGEVGIDAGDAGEAAFNRLARAGFAAAIGIVAATVLGIAVLGALLLFAERWFGYRLTREPDGSLRVRRGLLTRRSLSVAQERLRGVEIVEPLLLRAGRGAQARALAAGLAKDTQGGVLQPPVPRAEAHRVAAAVTGAAPPQTTRAQLRRHPRAATRRRFVRTLVPAAVLIAAAFVLDARLLGPVSLLLLPVATLLALDRARWLGHAVTPGYLVSRQGSVLRRTVALQRSGVIGWTVRQSVFQRRAGLATVEAVTGAGAGGYPVVDVAAADVAALLVAATPAEVSSLLPGGEPRLEPWRAS
jgi:putative membrane protein